MKFVEMQDDTRYESLELRLRTPEDENLFVVLKSSRITPDDPEGRHNSRVHSRMYGDCHQMRDAGFDVSVWKVSRQSLCEPLNVEGKPMPKNTFRKKGAR